MKLNKSIWLISALLWISFSMRVPIGGVGSLVQYIKAGLGLSSGVAGMLTTIPLLLFAASAPAAGSVSRIATVRTQVFFCLSFILSGILVRSYCGLPGLFAGTVLLGLGVGIMNVLMPIIIKTSYAGRIGLFMGIYTASMTAASAFTAGVSVWLEQKLSGWYNALGIFAAVPFVALLIWLPASGQTPEKFYGGESRPDGRFSFSRGSWYVAIFMGMQATSFFCLLAWLPSILVERGMSTETAAIQMLVLQLLSLSTNFATPIAVQRGYMKGWITALTASLYASGLFVLLSGSREPWILQTAIILLGLAAGAGFSLALTFIALRGANPAETARSSAFTQMIGYSMASVGPSLIGFIRDRTGNFTAPIIFLIAVVAAMCLMGKKSEDDSIPAVRPS